MVVDVTAGSPFDGALQQGDVILKLNSATPPDPQSVIGAIDHDPRASVSVQRSGEGVPTSTELALPKDLDE